jgi:RNA polymerase sigma factor (sigma-70 family)
MINAKEHFGLAATIAQPYVKRGERIEDAEAFSDALLGLTRAIQGFDPKKGIQFSTYAYYCIFHEVVRRRSKNRKIAYASLPQDVAEQEEEDYNYRHSPAVMVKEILDRYPEETETDKLNKKALVDHFIKGKVLSEIGEELGVGKERIRQRIEKAIEYIKENIIEYVN